MKKLLLPFICLFTLTFSFSQDEIDSTTVDLEQLKFVIDSLNNSFIYKTGTVDLDNGLAVLEVPKGFKFLDAEQSQYVLTELWGNPPSETLGLLFPEDMTPFHDNFTYCVEISYEDEGYIKDDDAADLDYDDLMKDMKKDFEEANEQRIAGGYGSAELIGWASPPYYDQVNKKLHWAKEIYFEGEEVNTLNYNIRVLGRKGFLVINAISDIGMLDEFNKDRDVILKSVEFTKGNQYSDFDPSIDKVAAYGIGGLIAGKLLAKAGFFALILKFWKIIAIAVVAFFGGIRKKLFGSKKDNQIEDSAPKSLN